MATRDHFLRALRGLQDNVGDGGVEKLATVLESKGNDADRKWQQNVLKAMADAVRKHGPDGVDAAYKEIEKLLSGKKVDFKRFTSLRVGSELLVELQNAEAEKKERARKFIQAAFQIIKQAVKAVL